MFGWGIGFYGPPIFLHAVLAARGWPIVTVAAAVTLHFLFGALVVANLPRLYGRLGIPTVTKAGAVALALGRSEEHTSELQSLMRISYAVFCLNKKKINNH